MFRADDYRLKAKALEGTLEETKQALDIDVLRGKLTELKAEQEKPEVWQDIERSAKLGREISVVEGKIGAYDKGKKALELLDSGLDLVYVHVEAPDESGHAGDVECKVEAIENIDRHILGYLMDNLKARGEDFAVMLLPDHPTPIEIRTHSSDPVAFVLYDSRRKRAPSAPSYCEAEAEKTGLFIEKGHTLMKKFISLDF